MGSSCSVVHSRCRSEPTPGRRPVRIVGAIRGEAAGRRPRAQPVALSTPSVIGNTSNRGAHVPYQAEYIWIDGTEPSPLLRSKTKIVRRRQGAGHLGLRRFEHQPGPGHDSDCVLQPVFIVPDPLRGPDDKLVMCEVRAHRLHPAPDQHPGQPARGGREVRRPGADVRHRAGVHLLQGRPPARLAGHRLPRPPGPVLLRRGRRQDARPRDRRAAHRGLHRGRASASRAPTPKS